MDTIPTTLRSATTVTVNGIAYRRRVEPAVVVCIDGGGPEYLDAAISAGVAPRLAKFLRDGYATIAQATVPSFTCPNNMSLVTGVPASVHGISGNFYFDPATSTAVPMTGPELLRSATILAAFADCGARVVAITAKDKLCRQLGKGLDAARGDICFSAEKVDACKRAEHGIEQVLRLVGKPLPSVYSAELSLFVLAAGARLLVRDRPELMYLSLTDYIQHKHAPDEPQALDFYLRIDEYLGRFVDLGAVVAVTADHGMSDKSHADGAPRVLYLQDILDSAFGTGATRVICPITDAYVAHHGALGGFVRVWCLRANATPAAVIARIRLLPGVEAALDRDTVCQRFDLPPDREGDIAVIARADTAIGAARADHDLATLGGMRLRSHGGLAEAQVPFVLSRPLNHRYRRRAAAGGLKTYEIFDYAINGMIGLGSELAARDSR